MAKVVEFVKSSPDVTSCPVSQLPEYAVLGRSNVGKSTLINYIAGNKDLAKTSASPGRTRLINHFLVDNHWHLVDLPGYGYAKVSQKERAKFSELIRQYLLHRLNLVNLFLLIDSRIPPQTIDLEFMQWLGHSGIAFSICFTKTDKITPSKLEQTVANYTEELLKTWEYTPRIFITSAQSKIGKEEILEYIESLNAEYKNTSKHN